MLAILIASAIITVLYKYIRKLLHNNCLPKKLEKVIYVIETKKGKRS
jgi:hypothetical protein